MIVGAVVQKEISFEAYSDCVIAMQYFIVYQIGESTHYYILKCINIDFPIYLKISYSPQINRSDPNQFGTSGVIVCGLPCLVNEAQKNKMYFQYSCGEDLSGTN